MNRRKLVIVAVLALASVPLFGRSLAEDPAQKPPTADEMQVMLQRWQEACTPGAQHADLARFIGEWDTETKMWMGGPGSEPMTSKGTTTIRWLFEGRWTVQESTGQMMGVPVKGHGLMGYDNYKKKYVGSWVDSMTTAQLTYEGNYDQSGNVLLCYGFLDEPMTGEHDKMVKYVRRVLGPDKFVFEIHDMPIGETNTKVIEITYTRRKA